MADPQAVGQTDTGLQRERNEDSFGVFPTPDHTGAALYIVADGMGGHAAGEVASALAVEKISAAFQADSHRPLAERLEQAIKTSNVAIVDASSDVGRQGMGSTVVCAAIENMHLVSAHVGDSRLYRVRRGDIEQLTADHSLVEEQVRAGLLSPEDAKHSTRRNIITRALGIQSAVDVDLAEHEIEPDDIYVLCTDGLSGQVDDNELRDTVQAQPPQEACETLIRLANERGGPDNITVLVVHVGSTATRASGVDRHSSGASSSKIGQVPVLPSTAVIGVHEETPRDIPSPATMDAVHDATTAPFEMPAPAPSSTTVAMPAIQAQHEAIEQPTTDAEDGDGVLHEHGTVIATLVLIVLIIIAVVLTLRDVLFGQV